MSEQSKLLRRRALLLAAAVVMALVAVVAVLVRRPVAFKRSGMGDRAPVTSRPQDGRAEESEAINALMDALAKKSHTAMSLAKMTQQLLRMREKGQTLWQPGKWMKDRDYYRALRTPELAEACFDGERAILGCEMMGFDDPRFAYVRLKVMHNGFAELFGRGDMWQGVLHAYDVLSRKIVPEATLRTIVRVSMELDGMTRLLTLPPLIAQVKGRERLFLKGHLKMLERYARFIDRFDPERIGSPTPFYREPCEIARTAVLLSKEVDPSAYASCTENMRKFTWPPPPIQEIEAVRKYISIPLSRLGDYMDDD